MSETNLPLIVEPEHLERALGAEGLLVVDVSEENVHAQHHVPGAVHLAYQAIIDVKPPAMGLLPDDRNLGEVLSALGMTADTHVVAYDDQGNGKAARCGQPSANQSPKSVNSESSGRQLTPLGQSGRAVQLEGIAAIEMAVLVKVIVDRGVSGSKLLQGLDVSEPGHRALSSSKRLM